MSTRGEEAGCRPPGAGGSNRSYPNHSWWVSIIIHVIIINLGIPRRGEGQNTDHVIFLFAVF